TQLGRARLTIEPPTALRPGQFASAVIETARDCGLSVPRSAVTYQNGLPTVQVLNGTKVETRSIRTGLSDETTVQVREGLAEDEPVVANAGTALRAGDRVTPVITGKVGTAR
ncbi:efflux RND transporter periplasmic adaptor subunit, partial [Methylobacterium trifolii]